MKTFNKTKQLILLAAFAGVAHGAPGQLATGIPSFLDTDGDGAISEAERQAFVESRKEARGGGAPDWDTNSDGIVDADERAAAVAALQAKADEKRNELFANLAGDDGELNPEEFGTLPPVQKLPADKITALFGLLDTDDDGVVTLEEFLAGVKGGANPPTTPPITPPTPPVP